MGELKLTRAPRSPIVCDPDRCHAQFSSCRVEFPTVAESVPSSRPFELRLDCAAMLTRADYTQDRQL